MPKINTLRRLQVKAGNLVKITRASIGIPADTLALITDFIFEANDIEIWRVQLLSGRTRRYLKRDLEVIE